MRVASRAPVLRSALADLTLSALSLGAAYLLRDGALPALVPAVFPAGLYGAGHYAALFAVAPALRAALAAWLGLSSPDARALEARRAWTAGARVLGVEALVLGALGFALQPLGFSRALILLYLLLSGPALGLRVGWALARSRRLGRRRRVAILGTAPAARAIERRLERRHAATHECLGCFGPDEEDARTVALAARAAELALDEVVLAAPAADWPRFARVLDACRDSGLAVRIEARSLLGRAAAPRLESFLGLPTLVLSAERAGPRGLAFKRALDAAGALALLSVTWPLLVLVAALVRWLDGPPVLFRQVRVGRNGRRFVLLKFHTMVPDAEARIGALRPRNEAGGPAFKLRSDPRVTRLGRVLRRLSLDELPQLWNVLRGDMSFVGPRPPLPDEVARYEPWQRRRLRMPPGITGPAQVCGRSELPFEEWVRLDLDYVERWSLALDARILLRTIPAVLSGRGAY